MESIDNLDGERNTIRTKRGHKAISIEDSKKRQENVEGHEYPSTESLWERENVRRRNRSRNVHLLV